ncbi:hypothetical protein JR316_0002936 [Psilocybe cubensis]|uniref:CENP-V/GFA domain-containing protein n=2 Tax=Psilocybe cubensis TaxID=181762 RepID=A0A8H7XZV1_PSICU|nr:hypothetical protein JR316_0002936 [Psilocybe cubensis]KAH9483468.1 hypothetical protein JR316_0002936 [Psilocybe cubensis]
MALTFINASCHCNLNAFKVPFATSKLPIASELCHCNICRHSTGTMAVHTVPIDGAPLSAESKPGELMLVVADLSKLKTYTAQDKITRYFCSVCFTHLFHEIKEATSGNTLWAVYTGTLERVEGIVNVGHHTFVAETGDGGLADHYLASLGKKLPRYAQEAGTEEVVHNWRSDTILKKESNTNGVIAHCHCKNVTVHLVPLSKEDAQDPSKWWAVPPRNPEDPSSHVRFMCGHCFCSSCRRSNGAHISTYILLPMGNVEVLDKITNEFVPISLRESIPSTSIGLKRYESSPLVFREYCEKCGANVLYWTIDPKRNHIPPPTDGKPSIINIAVGLIDQEDNGARAEDWVYWAEYVVRPEEAIDKAGMEAVKEGVLASTKSASIVM